MVRAFFMAQRKRSVLADLPRCRLLFSDIAVLSYFKQLYPTHELKCSAVV